MRRRRRLRKILFGYPTVCRTSQNCLYYRTSKRDTLSQHFWQRLSFQSSRLHFSSYIPRQDNEQFCTFLKTPFLLGKWRNRSGIIGGFFVRRYSIYVWLIYTCLVGKYCIMKGHHSWVIVYDNNIWNGKTRKDVVAFVRYAHSSINVVVDVDTEWIKTILCIHPFILGTCWNSHLPNQLLMESNTW